MQMLSCCELMEYKKKTIKHFMSIAEDMTDFFIVYNVEKYSYVKEWQNFADENQLNLIIAKENSLNNRFLYDHIRTNFVIHLGNLTNLISTILFTN